MVAVNDGHADALLTANTCRIWLREIYLESKKQQGMETLYDAKMHSNIHENLIYRSTCKSLLPRLTVGMKPGVQCWRQH